jgi:hypothetical protein
MLGSEELFGRYNPSSSNDKVLSQLQRFRDQELDRLKAQGDQRVMAEREKLQNITAIPDKLASGYMEGAEEGRRSRAADLQDQAAKRAEEAALRQQELHPLEKESLQTRNRRDTFGLAEEEKLAGDNQRRRDWMNAKRTDGSGLTNEQYGYQLQEDQQKAGIANTKAGTGLAGVQTTLGKENVTTVKEDRIVKTLIPLYQQAIVAGDQATIDKLDAQYGTTTPPHLLQTAKIAAQAGARDQITTANLVWNNDPQGIQVNQKLGKIQDKAIKLQTAKAYISEYKKAGTETDRANSLKQNIIAIFSSPEMGEEGKILADQFASGALGLRADLGGISTASQRLDTGLDTLNNSIAAELKQIEVQYSHVKAPAYKQNLQSAKNAFELASKTPTKQAPPPFYQTPQNNSGNSGLLQNVNIPNQSTVPGNPPLNDFNSPLRARQQQGK